MPFNDPDARREYERAYFAQDEVKKKRAVYNASWRKKNLSRRKETEDARKINKRAQLLVTNARSRARKKGIAFDLDGFVDQIQKRIDAGKCEITGFPFNLLGGRTFDSPSIDRINAAQGYTYGNIRIVLHMVNAAMGDWGDERLREVMSKWLL